MYKDKRVSEFNVSKLTAYLETTLEYTNQARKSISESCEETRKVLKCWTFPDQDGVIDESLSDINDECTCQISAFNESSEDIAKGIGNIVENAQKLREKMTINQSKPTSKSQISNKPAPISNRSANLKTNGSVTLSGGVRNGLSKTSLNKIPVTRAILPNTAKNSVPVSKLKRPPSSQSTYQKDFASRPSSRISSDSIKSTASRTKEPEKCILKSQESPITMAQLEQLLDRVAVDATLYASQKNMPNCVESSDIKKLPIPHHKSCLIHGKNVPEKKAESSVKLVEFKEAISIAGVPSKLVKILQPYHRFIFQHESGEKPTESKSAARFLSKLNNMNKSSWDEAMYEPLAGAFAKYLPLCSKVTQLADSRGQNLSKDISLLRENLEKLDTAYRKCTGKEISASVDRPLLSPIYVELDSDTNNATLALAGIWNDRSLSFVGMAEALCVRYNNVKQLKRFYRSVQRIQRLDFQLGIMDLVAKEIVPRLGQIDSDNAAFFLLVKTLIALCDLQHFKMPIIVKSD